MLFIAYIIKFFLPDKRINFENSNNSMDHRPFWGVNGPQIAKKVFC